MFHPPLVGSYKFVVVKAWCTNVSCPDHELNCGVAEAKCGTTKPIFCEANIPIGLWAAEPIISEALIPVGPYGPKPRGTWEVVVGCELAWTKEGGTRVYDILYWVIISCWACIKASIWACDILEDATTCGLRILVEVVHEFVDQREEECPCFSHEL